MTRLERTNFLCSVCSAPSSAAFKRHFIIIIIIIIIKHI